jgi:hypothetical protein
VSRAEKRELSQHLHRKHNGTSLAHTDVSDMRSRLAFHEELHQTTVCDHEHQSYLDPSVYLDLVKDA